MIEQKVCRFRCTNLFQRKRRMETHIPILIVHRIHQGRVLQLQRWDRAELTPALHYHGSNNVHRAVAQSAQEPYAERVD